MNHGRAGRRWASAMLSALSTSSVQMGFHRLATMRWLNASSTNKSGIVTRQSPHAFIELELSLTTGFRLLRAQRRAFSHPGGNLVGACGFPRLKD
jgi:hypothetical protein